MAAQRVLVINCGSSSLKFAIVDSGSGKTLIDGLAENINGEHPSLSWKIADNSSQQALVNASYNAALTAIHDVLSQHPDIASTISAVGHRVVHGGEAFQSAILIDEAVLQGITQCVPLAPLHNPANLEGIQAAKKLYPNLPHVAVFDTAFHQSLPDYAYTYAVPYEWYRDLGVRRYGFHGTSHRYVTQQAAKQLHLPYENAAFVSAHLGNGCSASAVLNGKSIDTSMGMTPLEGLVMGTRCGDLDPSLHAYLCEQLGLSINELTETLNKKSGLLGLSGTSFDMRTLESESHQGHLRAILAIEIFSYRLAKTIAALAVPLKKLDALVFTGGIGENSTLIRRKVLSWLSLLNFQIDIDRNAAHGAESSGLITSDSSTAALVIKTDEQLAIARETEEVLCHTS